jgi:hypothetical protein
MFASLILLEREEREFTHSTQSLKHAYRNGAAKPAHSSQERLQEAEME